MGENSQVLFIALYEKCQTHIEAYDSLHRLATTDENEISQIYEKIKSILIEKNKIDPSVILSNISYLCYYRNCYLRSYWTIFQKIYEEFQPKSLNNIATICQYFLFKEYGVIVDRNKEDYIKQLILDKNYELDLHENGSIFNIIMHDDKEKFIYVINGERFNAHQVLVNDFYPKEKIDLLELCSYHGAVDCFKILRTKFKLPITQNCLRFSFLSGVLDIVSECLKFQKVDKECMKYAIISHNIDFVGYLMDQANYFINLDLCFDFNNLSAFFVYLDKTNDVNIGLIYAVNFNLYSIIDVLVSHGASLDTKDDDDVTLLHRAATWNSKETAQLLISHGADVNAKMKNGETPLHFAAKKNSIETLKLLIENGANVNMKCENGRTALHSAAFYNKKESAEILIDSGSDVNFKDLRGKTPLHLAAIKNSHETANLLISRGSEVNIKCDDGKTPLHYAAEMNSQETVQILISNGAKVTIKDKNLKIPLHFAAFWDNTNTVDLLIDHGSDFNDVDQNGKTPLHYAAFWNCAETAKILILYGADIDYVDNDGETPIDIALKTNSYSAAQVLVYYANE
ncbi:hypothetical protein TVAG_017440 [Trichomonas vaginalis G3]|uniref:DUF3447 domain-containing protein n=1 Tax=Trichomonas vaginalis (strain ATCC PRA-98 / G3) TaxID=412133 RepID=A2FAU3_TRIV3|nr:spectrin binding [Trichomonas vaginalis G3]EAX97972.1 hypothetical protein TVAG_017440 [Trichomonas vaginalis G3]KAI5502579.1 spectrin binding [Trichomonas vaginalis G3]|eukprot:XP_001310902.1 hypothetical protein [Trichomonas vaginalis G3]